MKHFIKILFIVLMLIFQVNYSIAEETLILFDASISMNDSFYGKPKYIVASDETKNILASLPTSRTIGFRTIGIKLDGSVLNYLQNPNLMCQATQLEVPIVQNSYGYISSSLENIFPLGTTPLEYALRQTVNNDFKSGNHLKHIILITDGAESCNGDPCRYIRELMRTRNDIKVDIIAISVNGDDFKQLKCITDYSKGTIINITNPSQFKTAFNSVLQRNNDIPIQSQQNNLPNNVYKNEIIKYSNYLIEIDD